MALKFKVERISQGYSVQWMETLNPRNPFLTAAYVNSRIEQGWGAWALLIQDVETQEPEVACTAFLKKGTVSCGLDIPSLPDLQQESVFWDGLRGFCKQEKVTDLGLNTFASGLVSIPVIGTEVVRRNREEFVIDLSLEPLLEELAKNHRRNVRKAERAGLNIRVTREPDAAHQHALLVAESSERRRGRGEDTSDRPLENVFSQLLSSGVACIYQAMDGSDVVSSVLLLMAKKGAYYHSAGTSPGGMSLGASPFLILNIARELHSKGFEIFNLGGADASQAGLVRFKSGFNTECIALVAVDACLQSGFRRKIIDTIRKLRSTVANIVQGSYGQLQATLVSSAGLEISEKGAIR